MGTKKRNLSITLAFCGIALILALISILTNYWVILEVPNGFYRNVTGRYMIEGHSGLWRTCRMVVKNMTDPNENPKIICASLVAYASRHNLTHHPEVDESYLGQRVTSAAFSIVGIVLLTLGLLSGLYCLVEQRYMFKRLSAALFLMCAAAELVTIEVLMSALTYAAARLPARVPGGSYLHYGYSFFLNWVVFLIALVAGFTFLIYSKKNKGVYAASEAEAKADEPYYTGR